MTGPGPVRRGAIFCVLIDPEHDIAGFVLDWIRALAAKLDSLEVVALEVRDLAGAGLPPNVRVHSMGKEKGYARPRLLLNSQRALVKALDRADFLLCHMMPVYALVSAPLCRLKKKPLILWYTHQNLDLKLRLAVRVSDRIVTAAPGAMRVRTPKRRVIGHGIDTQRFSPGPLREKDGPLRVVSVGRLSPVKRLEFLVEAASWLAAQGRLDDFRFILVGQPSDQAQAEYVRGVTDRIQQLGLGQAFDFAGTVPFARVAACYQEADLFVSMQEQRGAGQGRAGGHGLRPARGHGQTAPFEPLLGELCFPDDLSGPRARSPGADADLDHLPSRARLPDGNWVWSCGNGWSWPTAWGGSWTKSSPWPGRPGELPGRAAEPMDCLVLIPTYNEAENIREITRAVLAQGERFGVLIIDDNSPDRHRPHGRPAQRGARAGKGPAPSQEAGPGPGLHRRACSTGWRPLRPPSSTPWTADFFPRSQRPAPAPGPGLRTGADMVVGSRYCPGGATQNWGLGRKMIKPGRGPLRAVAAGGFDSHDPTGGFNLYRRQVVQAIDLPSIASDGYGFPGGRPSSGPRKKGFKVQDVPITFADRRVGESKMSRAIVLEAFTLVIRLRLKGI